MRIVRVALLTLPTMPVTSSTVPAAGLGAGVRAAGVEAAGDFAAAVLAGDAAAVGEGDGFESPPQLHATIVRAISATRENIRMGPRYRIDSEAANRERLQGAEGSFGSGPRKAIQTRVNPLSAG